MLRRLLDAPTEVLDECALPYGRTFQLRLGPVQLVVVGAALTTMPVAAQPERPFGTLREQAELQQRWLDQRAKPTDPGHHTHPH